MRNQDRLTSTFRRVEVRRPKQEFAGTPQAKAYSPDPALPSRGILLWKIRRRAEGNPVPAAVLPPQGIVERLSLELFADFPAIRDYLSCRLGSSVLNPIPGPAVDHRLDGSLTETELYRQIAEAPLRFLPDVPDGAD